MMINYNEIATIEKIQWHGQYEADISVKLLKNGRTLECFATDDETRKFIQGKEYEVKFYLIDFKVSQLESRVKDIVQLKSNVNRQATNRHIVEGQIAEIKDNENPLLKEYQTVIVDCGFYLQSRVKKGKFKKGDFVRIEGRLDAHKVEVENK